MLVRELINLLAVADRDAEVMVSLFQENGTSEVFEIEDISLLNGFVHIEISEVG
jgi:hypothetical protein